MLERKLGRSDLSVSVLCFGGNVFGWTVDERNSFAVLDAFVKGGGNFIDTADVYGVGASETILGKWMKARKNREQIILATKVGSQMGSDASMRGLSRQYILSEVEASLKRLQTDYIDLYQTHRDDPNTPLDETLAALNDLVQQGKVRYIGASNYSATRLRKALQVSQLHGFARFESVQPPYNLVNRGEYEGSLEELCIEQDIGVITYSSLASGFLTGKYRPHQPLPASPRASRIRERYMNKNGFSVLEQIDHVAEAHHATDAQVALAWILAQPGITSAIASATSAEQVDEMLGSVNLHLSEEEMAALDTASAWSKNGR
ncbi:MAG TPA: aldo/keto reductase [Ktedonobacteraceae bacterium]|nr:aldo/keto reductase [Ktedonobacteraceae bacterium]